MGGAAAVTIPGEDPVAVELVLAIRAGDTGTVRRLVGGDRRLAGARLAGRGGTRTPLHVVADWPGYFPGGPEVVALLIGAGADPDAVTAPGPGETPLHWAASSDDCDVAAALIDGGADIERPGGSIGTPLDNAVGYSCWHVARLLAARGARVDKLWHAAALGMLGRVGELLGQGARRRAGGVPGVLARLRGRAAAGRGVPPDPGREPELGAEYAEGTPLDAAGSDGTRRENVVTWLRDLGAAPASPAG